MQNLSQEQRNLIFAGLIGAIFGGLLTLGLTNAIPRMMNTITSGMMEKMMTRMQECDCSPDDQ